jgi:hypothetical protein
MKRTMRANSGLVYIADVADDLLDQAEILLRLLANEDPALAAGGAPVRLDWGLVRLERRGDEVVVEEPDYRRDPLQFLPGLNFTCAVLRAQQRVHERLGVGAEPVKYDQVMLVYPGGLSAAHIVATRQAPGHDQDSGWRVFDAAHIDWTQEPQARRFYQIPSVRPELMAVLSLPVGWSIRLHDASLAEAAPPGSQPMAVGMAIPL